MNCTPALAPLASVDFALRADDLAGVLGAVGAFLLGNAFLVAGPRRLVAERLSGTRAPLVALRELMFQRFLIGLACAYFCAAFALPLAPGLEVERGAPRAFPVAAVSLTLVGTLVLVSLGAWWTNRDFRALVRGTLRRAPADLESDPALAREVGLLFGVPERAGDTVASYASRLRRELALPVPQRRAAPLDDAASTFGDDAAD